MDMHPDFQRPPAEHGRERFTSSGRSPSLRLVMLGFVVALVALLGLSLALPFSTAGMLSSNSVVAGP